MKAITE